ncbi:MAG: site-specific integrase [Nevskia sp.]|nr:site-specific integrase [Nevskia sp.]
MAVKFSKLTRHAIRSLKPGEVLTEHGIEFARLPNSDGRYTVNVMVDGQRIHRTVGKESDGTTRTQAEEYIEKLRRDAKEDRLALPKGRKTALSFRDAAEKYLGRLAEEGGKDLEKKRERLNLHLVPFFGDKPLSKVATFDVERYKKHRLSEPSKRRELGDSAHSESPKLTQPGTVNRELAALSHLFNKAIEWGWIASRPAKIVRCKEGQGRITYLTVEQADDLLAAARADGSALIYPFILIGLETSMRRSEILSIRREHVDLTKRVVFIPKAKAGAREQPITARLAEYLKTYLAELPAESQWLFESLDSKSGHVTEVRTPFRRVVISAGLNPKEVVRHTLRHTAITHLVQAGVDLPTVKRISGHKTLVMVERYAHQSGAHIQAAMDKLEDRYSKKAASS